MGSGLYVVSELRRHFLGQAAFQGHGAKTEIGSPCQVRDEAAHGCGHSADLPLMLAVLPVGLVRSL